MIGVFASEEDLGVAGELFELFKTPWEPAVAGRAYGAVLSTTDRVDHLRAGLVVLFGAAGNDVDRAAGVAVTTVDGVEVPWERWTFPVFGPAGLFRATGPAALKTRGAALDYAVVTGSRRTQRVGYDLFGEVRHLLTTGQPVEYASVPTLEIHIALLRYWLTQGRVPFVELLPRPAGRAFICCLTHDVDFVGMRRHGFDRTLAGFAWRASIGTALDVIRGRRPAGDLIENLAALCRLPFIFLGMSRDFWQPFEDYAACEDSRHSTFFLVPFKDRPGVGPDGRVHSQRAVRYQLSEVAEEVLAAAERGSEIGIHGINAWRDGHEGAAELQQLCAVVPSRPGIRMHWLYNAADTPRHLEAAGFTYDSTWGYNDAVGYRAGTTQVFRLHGTSDLLELPLAIMDSALLSSGRQGLSGQQALDECRQIIADVRRFGGTLVINWHCRSLAPERLWGGVYRRLLDELQADGQVWFTTARTAVEWFRWRRAVTLSEYDNAGTTFLRASAPCEPAQPALLRVHRIGDAGPAICDIDFVEATSSDVPLGDAEVGAPPLTAGPLPVSV